MSLRRALASADSDTAAKQEAARSQVQRRIAALIADATVSRSEAFEAVKKEALRMIQDRKESVIVLNPVTEVVDVARAQGGAAALNELLNHFAQADKQAALAQKQTTGQ